MVTRGDKPSEKSDDAEWLGVDDFLAALQSTMQRADERLSKAAKGGIQYAATDFTISFPAEIDVKEDRTVVRLPSRMGKGTAPVSESQLSRFTLSMKPVLSLEEEAVKPEKPEKPPVKPAKPVPVPVKPEKPSVKPEKKSKR